MSIFNEILTRNIEDRDERIRAIQDAIDAGHMPDENMRARLADYILREEINDPNPYKSEHNEYPIFSERQLARRRTGREDGKGNMRGEISLNEDSGDDDGKHHAKGVFAASDGQNYRTPIRRTRSVNELILIDEHAKIRNQRRRRAYNAFVAGKDTYTHEGEKRPIAFIKKAEAIR